MSEQPLDIPKRIATLKAVLSKEEENNKLNKELKDAKDDWDVAMGKLDTELCEESLKKVELANVLADWPDDNVPLVKAFDKDPKVNSLRDVALRFNVEKLAANVDPKDVPETVAGAISMRSPSISSTRSLLASMSASIIRW